MFGLHDGTFTHVAGAIVTALGSGVGFRYISIAARDIPQPEPTDSRWYKFFYNFLQDAFANPDKKVK
jgi:hypothetical protein